jgi:MFS family permease
MKLNTKRTVLVGFAFLSICAFWQMYNSVIPLILTNTFHMSETISGVIMSADNILALFLLPLFGAISDRCKSPLGRRRPFILFGTVAAVALMLFLPVLDNSYAAAPRSVEAGLVHHGAGRTAGSHGLLSLSRRGADAGCDAQAPALQGQRHHQSHGRRGWRDLPADCPGAVS